ncbi:hypothetical protein BN2476_1380036 [Paraburkholderia piptadeniae]|uniref:Uncharacterized protein n=2 Tax=Paraburkholderia TaxID=1822464 RepID=A0A7X1NH20_9BURK|nr:MULTISPECIES: hypothetical protein [Paraburkholderia]MPW21742.1 hypothetical protein [Paraburkholderia franconis]SIT51775.1 hypothetical protein BN2476_1380036 [Paraburkholderia piptadeniae]
MKLKKAQPQICIWPLRYTAQRITDGRLPASAKPHELELSNATTRSVRQSINDDLTVHEGTIAENRYLRQAENRYSATLSLSHGKF